MRTKKNEVHLQAQVMARVKTKTLGNTLQIPRALTLIYGKNPDSSLFQKTTYRPHVLEKKKNKKDSDNLMHQLVIEELHFK